MKRVVLRTEIWEILLYAFVLTMCAPNTFISRPVEYTFQHLCRVLDLDCSSPIREPSATLAYWTGMPLMFGLLMMAISQSAQNGKVKSLVNAVVLFALLFISDWFLSTEPFFRYSNKAWAPYVFATFLLVALLADARQAHRLMIWALVVASVESCYAVVAHLTGQPEFVTPHFGRRAGGSFHTTQPNTLYPLSMLAVPVAMAYALHAPNKASRIFYLACTGINIAALVFTFSRAGWLGLSLACLFLSWVERRWFHSSRVSAALLILAFVLLVSTALVRTQGRLIGNREDRAARGRIAIWKVALMCVKAHPVLGSGIGTYRLQQSQHMTDELLRYGPANEEAKNLLLSILADTGLVGLLLWGNVWMRCAVLCQQCFHRDASSRTMLIGSGASYVALHVAGLFDTPILHTARVPSTLFAFLLLGCLCATFYGELPKERLETPAFRAKVRNSKWLFVLLVMLALGAVIPFILLTVRKAAPGMSVLRSKNYVVSSHSEREVFITDIPAHLIHLLIASEDGNFYRHHGVDWQALHRALRVNLRSLSYKQGGSTITMQTARYLFLGKEKSLSRKIAEILLALEMEKHLSKERILELYLNSARFGLGAEDIGTACRVYFGKKPSELTLAEAAFLAGVLPEPPSRREELTPEKVERCKRRALSRLAYFFPTKYSPQQIERAMGEKVVFVWER
ncbi:MAG: transglycosylase domain-containing protein, partial [Armatimonadota bacterium]